MLNVETHIVDEIREMAEGLLHETRGNYNEQLKNYNLYRIIDQSMCIMSAVVAATAGVVGLADIVGAWLAGVLGLAAAILAALNTAIGAKSKKETASQVWAELKVLATDLSQFIRIDLSPSSDISEQTARQRLTELTDRYNELQPKLKPHRISAVAEAKRKARTEEKALAA